MNTVSDNCYFTVSFYRIFLRKIQIVMTFSVLDKAKVNAKHYVELCYPN